LPGHELTAKLTAYSRSAWTPQRGLGGRDRVGIADRHRRQRHRRPHQIVVGDPEVGRPGPDVVGVGRAGPVVVDALGLEHEAGQAVGPDRRPHRRRDVVGHRVVGEGGAAGQLDQVAALHAGDRAVDGADPGGGDRARVQPAGDDGHGDPGRLQLGDRGDVAGVDAVVGAQQGAVEVQREQAVRHRPASIAGRRPG
jgi:hypothetical protein